jgi:hypothetical protein
VFQANAFIIQEVPSAVLELFIVFVPIVRQWVLDIWWMTQNYDDHSRNLSDMHVYLDFGCW